jgi:hypothetical protein
MYVAWIVDRIPLVMVANPPQWLIASPVSEVVGKLPIYHLPLAIECGLVEHGQDFGILEKELF